MAEAGTLVSTKDVYGKRVYKRGKKGLTKVGKIHNFVFHPTQRVLIGFLVKRPDAAMMFHRKDLFVRLGGLQDVEGDLVISGEPNATDNAACKYLKVDFDQCVLWWNMPLCTKDGTLVGYVEAVQYDDATGQVDSLVAGKGAASDALLGKVTVDASLVSGFKRGLGQEKAFTDKELAEDAATYLGAILVDDAVLSMESTGGVMEKAGQASAKATHKVRVVKKAVKPKADEAAQATAKVASGVAQATSKAAGEAAEKGLFAAGKQLGRASGMFGNFKEEFDKARNAD